MSGPGEQEALDLTARLWQGPPRSFFSPQPFQGQESMRQHDQRDMMMPAVPIAAFVVIVPQLLLKLPILLFDLPAAFDAAYQAPQGVVLGQVAENVFRGLLLAGRPIHQQPDLRMGRLTLVESVRGLDAASEEA